MTSLFGLPRFVVTLLRQMEPHKDCLKWNIAEGTHKITLTLAWNFQKHRVRENLWERLQRTLRLSKSQGTSIPEDLSKLLQMSPKKKARSSVRRELSWTAPLRSQSGWSSLSSFSLPHRSRPRPPVSLPQSPALRLPPTDSDISPSRFSCPSASYTSPGLNAYSNENTLSMLTPETPCSSQTWDSSRKGSPIKITYRTEDEIESSLEDIVEKTREKTKEELECIRQEWNSNIVNWPRLMLEDSGVGPSASTTDTESDPSLKHMNQAVQHCLHTCDKILYRHSTEIT